MWESMIPYVWFHIILGRDSGGFRALMGALDAWIGLLRQLRSPLGRSWGFLERSILELSWKASGITIRLKEVISQVHEDVGMFRVWQDDDHNPKRIATDLEHDDRSEVFRSPSSKSWENLKRSWPCFFKTPMTSWVCVYLRNFFRNDPELISGLSGRRYGDRRLRTPEVFGGDQFGRLVRAISDWLASSLWVGPTCKKTYNQAHAKA